jgi:hypothetical protein
MTDLNRFSVLVPYLPIFVVWLAVLATSSLVCRELGFARILRKYPFTVFVMALCLAALPAAGLMKVTRPYQRRIMALLRRETSPAILGAGCPVFPQDNIWNRAIAGLPVDEHSRNYVGSIGADAPLHPDFGQASGIPYAVSDGSDRPVSIAFGNGAPESDRGTYRIPENAPVEQGTDGHVLVLNRRECVLYELYAAVHRGPRQWFADSAAIFDLRSNRLRPDGWTSADAAGLPILPGLVRYDEVAAGRIGHAVRFTARMTRRACVWPAKHYASHSTDPHLPPMGQRFRLRGSFDVGGFSPQARVILTALKEYGMILADNGGNWFISGAPDSRWASSLPAELRRVHGSDFEAVDSQLLMISADSAQARP